MTFKRTPPPTEGLTKQVIFDFVCEHLMRQGQPASHRDECVYRTPEGRACAVGCLITDEEYVSEMEGLTALSLARRGFLPERLCPFKDLLYTLQVVHDDTFVDNNTRKTLSQSLRATAKHHNFEIPNCIK